MEDKEFKNQKIRNDIQTEFSPAAAKLALGILEIVERSDGNPDSDSVRKLAKKCFEESEAK